MIAQKMWDDKYLSNADFSYIYPFFDTKQVNMLEMKQQNLISSVCWTTVSKQKPDTH